MKKALPHIIYILIIAFFIVYANIKASEADKQSMLAQENIVMAHQAQVEAEHQAAMAKEQTQIAEANAAEAFKLHKELEACKSSK